MNLALKYPTYSPRIRQQQGQPHIFDFIRRRWLVLTPEEWVRQHVLNYLVTIKNYPPASIAVEKELELNDLKKRFDIVVYSRTMQPLLIVECKAPYIALNEGVLEQALRYNLILKAPFIMITNGVSDAVYVAGQRVEELPAAQ